MKSIGFAIDTLPVELTRARVIEYFEGDRIVEYRSRSNDPYFKIWSDTDGDLTRWLVLRLTDSDVARFLHGARSVLDLILGACDGHVYVVDARGASTLRVSFLPVSDIPPQHLPTHDSFYDETLTPECEARAPPEQLVLLDGEWNAEALAQFERKYTQVYAFNALFGAGSGKDINGMKDSLGSQVFGSEGAPVNALDQIVAAMPRDANPRVKAIQWPSPGVVRYAVDSLPAARVRDMLSVLRSAAGELEKKYKSLHHPLTAIHKEACELQSHNHLDEMRRLLTQPNPSLQALGRALAEQMGVDPHRIKFVAGSDVNSAELIASYYRRSVELYQHEIDGAAVIV